MVGWGGGWEKRSWLWGNKGRRREGIKHHRLSSEERFLIAALRSQGLSLPEIAQVLERHRSTIWREVRRNCAPYDGGYRSRRAHQRAHARRWRSRRNHRFGSVEMARVEGLLREAWSPEQVAGYLRRAGELSISHETSYRHDWRALKAGETLHLHLRCARKQCRKPYGRYDSRGRLAGKENDRRATCRRGEAEPHG